MNSRIGSLKKVNVILVEFDNKEDIYGQYQQAKWLGGKKNDIVITYSMVLDKIAWVYVFGWTEQDIVKRNIESLIIDKGIVNNTLIPEIEKEIVKSYQIKDWKKFDYLTIYPTVGYIILYIFIILGIQISYWYWAINNYMDKK